VLEKGLVGKGYAVRGIAGGDFEAIAGDLLLTDDCAFHQQGGYLLAVAKIPGIFASDRAVEGVVMGDDPAA
jgi:hypothetical protein